MKERHKMTANELAYELERPNNWQQENNFTTRAATMLRQQQADKDRALRILKEVDGVLLDYIEQLEKKPMTTLAHGRGVALAVKYMIAVLEEAQEK